MKKLVAFLLVIILSVFFVSFSVCAREQKDYNVEGGLSDTREYDLLEKVVENGNQTVELLKEIRDLLKQQNEAILEDEDNKI